ncbi:MAG: hypothetical protein U0229_24105 [Anaeromyxobacter sp.]
MSGELDSDVTRPLDLPPRSSGRDDRSLLLVGTGVLVFVAAVDAGLAGLGPRTPLWAAWIALFLANAWAAGRFPGAVNAAVTYLPGLGAVVFLTALAAVSGGATSLFLQFLLAIPLLSAIARPGRIVEPILFGVASVASGATLLVLGRAPGVDLVLWVATAAAAVAFAVIAGRLEGRRQARYFESERERADALARLAEVERAQASAQAWVAKGQLAEEVAHALNSPLGAARSSLAYARAELEQGHIAPALEAIWDAAECVERIQIAIASLQVLHPPQAPQGSSPST